MSRAEIADLNMADPALDALGAYDKAHGFLEVFPELHDARLSLAPLVLDGVDRRERAQRQSAKQAVLIKPFSGVLSGNQFILTQRLANMLGKLIEIEVVDRREVLEPGNAAAVGLLYYYWDNVAPYFNRLKDALIGTFSDLWSKFKAIWDDLCALASAFFSGDWGEFAQRLGSLFSDALSALKSVFFLPFTLLWDGFKSAFPQAAESIKSAFENIKAYFADAVAGIKSAITPLIDFFAGLWGAIKSAFFDNFIKAMDGVRNAASWVGDKFSGAISGVKSFFGSSDESAPKNVSALPAPVSQGITSANPQGKIEVLVRTDEGAKAEVVDQHSNPGLTLSPHTENGRLR